MRFVASTAVVLLVSWTVGCGGEDPVGPGLENLDGSQLLGLANNRTLTYLRIDTVVTIGSSYEVTVTTSSDVIRIVSGGGTWTVKDGEAALVSLRVTSDAVIQIGYWRKIGGKDSLMYFAVPPVVMHRNLKAQRVWEGFTPRYDTDTSTLSRLFYFSYFGFHFRKEYRGTVDLVVPAGSFTAHRFDVELFAQPSDTVAALRVSEFYVPLVGLVQLQLQGGPLKRTLSLVGHD